MLPFFLLAGRALDAGMRDKARSDRCIAVKNVKFCNLRTTARRAG
jgi:hypothetical protein